MTAAHLPGAILTPRCRGVRAVARFSYGCMKSRVGASDAGSIPATSTTTGVHGFDGALIRDGQPAMVPAASGSPLSRGPVRWAKSKLPTTTAITSRCFALRDAPAGRGVTKAGTFFNAADARSRATHLRAGWLPSAETHPCKSQMQKHGPEMPARRSSARPAALFNAVSNERSPEPGRCLVSSEAPGCRGDAYTQPSPCEMTTHCMAKANAGAGGRHDCTHHSDRKRRR